MVEGNQSVQTTTEREKEKERERERADRQTDRQIKRKTSFLPMNCLHVFALHFVFQPASEKNQFW